MFYNKQSLRIKLIITLVFLVAFQSLSLITSLQISGVFLKVDEQIVSDFERTALEKRDDFETNLAKIVQNVSLTSKEVTSNFTRVAKDNNANINEMWLYNSIYVQGSIDNSHHIINLLEDNNVSGAYLVLNQHGNDEHNSIYIRNTSPLEPVMNWNNFEMMVGPGAVAKNNNINVNSEWTLNMKFDSELAELGTYDFFEGPSNLALEHANLGIDNFGYWCITPSLFNPKENSAYYSIPLLDDYGTPFGVIGVELSSQFFVNYYLTDTRQNYEQSFYAIVDVNDNMIKLNNEAPKSALANNYMTQTVSLSESNLDYVDFYELNLDSLGDVYCTIDSLNMYSKSSPYKDEEWKFACFVPKNTLHESSAVINNIFQINFIVITFVAFIISFILVFATTRKIEGLSDYVKQLSPHDTMEFKPTGLLEIDDLTDAITMLNEKVIQSSKTIENILRLSALDIGGYEILPNNGGVVATEYVYALLQIDPSTSITNEEWENYYKTLTRRRAWEKEDTFKYKFNGKKLWLRILTSETEDGNVGMILDITKEMEEAIAVKHLLDYDKLTNLYNRVAFGREVKNRIDTLPERIGAMLFIDLDNLKYMNDTFGHEVGDLLITSAGDLFRKFENIGGKVARISGDEFAIYLHGYESKEALKEVVNTTFESFESARIDLPNGNSQKIRYSTGISWYPDDAEDVNDLIKLSDFAMYEAKNNSKGTIKEFNGESYRKNVYLLENREAINKLLDDRLIRFMFQPIVDLKTGEIFAFEALMRSKLEAFKSPMEILKVATAQVQLGKLEQVVVLGAIEHAYEYRKDIGNAKIFVNSITSQSISLDEFAMLRGKYGKFLEQICIEITEAEDNTPEQMSAKVQNVRECNMSIAIDDFGSGYSNEIRIISIQPDVIKIDMELIRGIHRDFDKQKLVSNLVNFCHGKDVRVVAEGVEEIEDLMEIMRIGVDFVQGFYIARPSFDILQLSKEKVDEIVRLNEKIMEERQGNL